MHYAPVFAWIISNFSTNFGPDFCPHFLPYFVYFESFRSNFDHILKMTWISFQFHLGPWSGCSALCGEGTRKRKVTCFSKLANGTIEELDDEDCADEKPAEEEPCFSDTPCEAADWLLTEWSGCDESCGKIDCITLCFVKVTWPVMVSFEIFVDLSQNLYK